jgi:hypothetical protein
VFKNKAVLFTFPTLGISFMAFEATPLQRLPFKFIDYARLLKKAEQNKL